MADCYYCKQAQCRGCPSPAEIAAATAKIRKGWSEREHYRRAGHRVPAHLASSYDDAASLAHVEVRRARGLEAPDA